MPFLLLCSGDVESDPLSPIKCLDTLGDTASLPSDPAKQMKVIFQMLKDVHTRSLKSSRVQTELVADVKTIKPGHKSIESKITAIQNHLEVLEEIYKNARSAR